MAAFAYAAHLQAHDDSGSDPGGSIDTSGTDGLEGGDDSGGSGESEVEDHHNDMRLLPTVDAPVSARGEAHIELSGTNPGDAATLKIEVKGLPAGTYTVNVSSLSTGSSSVLGTFDVPAATSGSDSGEDSESPEDSAKASIVFPAGIDPLDVASVQVYDAGGVLLLAGDGNSQGGDVSGTEHLEQEVPLVATADAPVGASGNAQVEADDDNGVNAAYMKVETQGLAAGTYTVSVTSLASGSSTVLGTFDVGAVAGGGDDGIDEVEFGSEAGLAFPDGFNPLDIATVEVADAGGVVQLTGDFSSVLSVTSTKFSAKVTTTPGSAAPNSTGKATLGARVRHHALRQSFSLSAKGAPAGTVLNVEVNGTPAGTVKSSKSGKVSLKKLPGGVSARHISSVVIKDASGHRVLSAHF